MQITVGRLDASPLVFLSTRKKRQMLDLGIFGHISFDFAFLSSLFSIVIIDLILAGDNAVVIAMAVRALPHDQRKRGILFGSLVAVLLRVALTFFVAQLLRLNYVKLAGGVLILWIAVKLFVEGVPEDEHGKDAKSIWQAIKIIVIADITMALDNMLAVGGASHGNLLLLLFGLGLSIPFIVFTSNLLSILMDRYPVIIYIGAAILGKVGGEMMITDPFTVKLLPPSLVSPDFAAPVKGLQHSIEAFFAGGVIIAGKLWMRWSLKREKEAGIMAPAAARETGGKPRAILTISREFGSGGREIGRAVSRELGYEYVDRDTILADIRRDGSKWEEWARNLDEHCPTIWEKYDWSSRGFAALVQLHILEHAAKGGVIMGRGGNFLLQDVPHAFSIRVQAPLDVRIERIMQRESVDKETACWLCEKTDSERSCFLNTIYGRRWDDPAGYDAVFDAGKKSLEEIVRTVTGAMRERERLATESSRNLVKMRAAAARVKAGIATNHRFFIPTFDVSYDGSAIVLRGVTHSSEQHRKIEEAARSLTEGVPLRCELHYRK